ncbi:MAG: hypothetical protein V3575_01190 [Candidatus Absconditabacteria bacterium]
MFNYTQKNFYFNFIGNYNGNIYNQVNLDNLGKMKLLKIFIVFVISSFVSLAYGASDWTIIPEADGDFTGDVNETYIDGQKVITEALKNVSTEDGRHFVDKYNEQAKELEGNLGAQIGSGIMNWNTILDYIAHIINFMSNLALVVAALSIIYAGYIYATQVFTGNVNKGKDAIVKALQGALFVIGAYAILRLLVFMFL